MPPLAVAGLGWILVILGVQPAGGGWDVTLDATGWSLVAYGWHRLVPLEATFGPARTVATVATAVALVRLIPLPEPVLTLVYVGSLLLVVASLALGATAVLAVARAGRSALVVGQASFLRWAGVALLATEAGAALGYLVLPVLGDLLLAAAFVGLAFSAWFTLLQLLSAGRAWARPVKQD